MGENPSTDNSSGIDSEQLHIPIALPHKIPPALGHRSEERRGDGLDDARSRWLEAVAVDLGVVGTSQMRREELLEIIRAELPTKSLQITIYLSDELGHDAVQSAVVNLLEDSGLNASVREDPVIGSWFRRIWATLDRSVHSRAVREGVLTAAHVADTRLVLAQDATITATLLQNLGPVLASLDSTKDAVLRIGALLIVKVDWTVNVFQLTAAQQARLDHQPKLAISPQDIIEALGPLENAAPRISAPEIAGER